MKSISLLFYCGLFLLTSCGSVRQRQSAATQPDSNLIAKMQVKPAAETSDPLILKFTVYNRTGKPESFCKWHTPFEPPMSKYLDITDANGDEVQYIGAMAKRVMPPPADSFIEVKAGDSLSVDVDLRKSYKIEQSGKYTAKYNSEAISGIAVKDSITFLIP